jgi:hypothetical protein
MLERRDVNVYNTKNLLISGTNIFEIFQILELNKLYLYWRIVLDRMYLFTYTVPDKYNDIFMHVRLQSWAPLCEHMQNASPCKKYFNAK